MELSFTTFLHNICLLFNIKTPSEMSQTKYSITVSNLSSFPSLSSPHNNTSMWGEPCFSVSDEITSHILIPEILALKILFSSQKTLFWPKNSQPQIQFRYLIFLELCKHVTFHWKRSDMLISVGSILPSTLVFVQSRALNRDIVIVHTAPWCQTSINFSKYTMQNIRKTQNEIRSIFHTHILFWFCSSK